MTDSLSTQMGRGKNTKRNKSTASLGSKKNRTQSSTSAKFQTNIDGFSAFIVAVSKLGKQGHEFTWHDLRKVYHKETQRQLTAEELNAIFSAKNMTKREIFELPRVKRFMTSMDGSMMCRFRLIADPEDPDYDDIPPLMSTSTDSDAITQSSNSAEDSQAVSPVMPNEKAIVISTDLDDKTGGPTSDLSKSDNSPSQNSLVQQSSVTDDEGWVSGKETRSDSSSPVEDKIENDKDEVDGGSKMELEDEVFESDVRLNAGSDIVDGSIVTDVMIVEEAIVEQNFKKADTSYVTPLVMTESISAAFEAVIQSVSNANAVLPETQNASEKAKVHATPRKVLSSPVPAERTTVLANELSAGKPIKELIEKFDTGVNFSEHKVKEESSVVDNVHDQVIEEIGGTENKLDQVFSSTKQEEHESAEVTNVIFRSTSTHSSIIANGKEQLAEFVAEQEARHKEKSPTPVNTTTDETENAFCVKEQASMSSLDREYFDSKTKNNEDLFAELGVNTDGFQLKTADSSKSGPDSSEIITVIETPQKKILDEARNRTDSIDSDADVPYSLCSEDEAEPMTMIDKSMKVSHSAEQLSAPKDEKKTKTVVVELDAKAKREPIEDVNASVKDRIAALQAIVVKKQVPIAKVDSVEEKDDIIVLGRSEELLHMPLPASCSPQSTGTVRRRQVRFMRGCCVVQ